MSSARPMAPPPPAPKPGRVKVYRALYDFQARSVSFNLKKTTQLLNKFRLKS